MNATPANLAVSPIMRRPSLVSLSLGRFVIEMKLFLREPEQVFFTFSLPVMFLVLFSAIFSGEIDPGPGGQNVSFAQYFLPGMIASGVMATTFTNIAMTAAIDQHQGLLKLLSGTPLPRSAYLIGKVLGAAALTIAQTALMLAIGLAAYDVSLPSGLERWAAFLVVLVVSAAIGCLLGLAYTRLIRTAQSAGATVQLPFLLLQFISGVYIQYEAIPSGLKAVASVFPLRWLAQGLRYAFLPDWIGEREYGSTWGWEWPIGVLLLWLVVSFVLASMFFRWNRQRD